MTKTKNLFGVCSLKWNKSKYFLVIKTNFVNQNIKTTHTTATTTKTTLCNIIHKHKSSNIIIKTHKDRLQHLNRKS